MIFTLSNLPNDDTLSYALILIVFFLYSNRVVEVREHDTPFLAVLPRHELLSKDYFLEYAYTSDPNVICCLILPQDSSYSCYLLSTFCLDIWIKRLLYSTLYYHLCIIKSGVVLFSPLL